MGSDQVVDDHVGNLLAGVVRLVEGAVAAAFVPKIAADSPIGWASPDHAPLATRLRELAVEHLANDGPWGAVTGARSADWTAWVEPVMGYASGDPEPNPGEPDPPQTTTGALAVVVPVRSHPFLGDDVDVLALFARLCAGVTRSAQQTGELAHQRRLDLLVSHISERLMSTTLPSLQRNLEWTMETLCRSLGAHAAFLRRNDHAAGTSVLVAEFPSRGIPAAEDPLGVVPFDSDPVFAASRDFKLPIILRAPSSDEDYASRVADGAGTVATGFSGAGVPLVHADVTEGCLAFVYLSAFDWSEHDVNSLRAVAALLVQLLHRIDAEERLRHSALTDELTGLANRRSLLDEVSRRRMSAACPLALLFLDLDRFKVMNDYLGHGAGDRLLRVIADRIRTSLRPADFAARLGGDEFVVLLADTGGTLGAVAAAERLRDIIAQPIDVGGRTVTHTGSIGIAVGDDERTTGEQLLGRADIALYSAKSDGRNRTVVFDGALEARVASRSDIELLLRKALSDQAFELFYQPEFDLRTGRILAVEALLRWRREGHGLVGANDFVPVAEETHLITEIDRWVLEEACGQAARWRTEHAELDLVVRVNMSPAQLAVPGVVETVTGSLARSGLPPEALCLEITEQAMIADVDHAVRILHDVRDLGVKLAIDDFGTGYSSMIQLKNLPVDALKIDRAFVDGIEADLTDQAIVESMVRLARAFHLEVVAEGVETLADLRTLLRLGCRRAQGFLLSHPLPRAELEPLLARGGIDLSTLAVATDRVAG
ncbi:MAG: putative bifunctional diguanylate cyclase/phosphodiesterase [Acidimicrobiales bacterium]